MAGSSGRLTSSWMTKKTSTSLMRRYTGSPSLIRQGSSSVSGANWVLERGSSIGLQAWPSMRLETSWWWIHSITGCRSLPATARF